MKKVRVWQAAKRLLLQRFKFFESIEFIGDFVCE